MDYYKFPRLYTSNDLKINVQLPLASDQVHYLFHVMRKTDGDSLRLFNGRDGEWRCEIIQISKKGCLVNPVEKMKDQPDDKSRVHLVYAPIKKDRYGYLIEKATELGATDFHAVITDYTNKTNIKSDRIQKWVAEAAEQCERLDIPDVHDTKKLDHFLADWPDTIPVIVGAERQDANAVLDCFLKEVKAGKKEIALLIGPEGGFSQNEFEIIEKYPYIRFASFGPNILRSETACAVGLSAVIMATQN